MSLVVFCCGWGGGVWWECFRRHFVEIHALISMHTVCSGYRFPWLLALPLAFPSRFWSRWAFEIAARLCASKSLAMAARACPRSAGALEVVARAWLGTAGRSVHINIYIYIYMCLENNSGNKLADCVLLWFLCRLFVMLPRLLLWLLKLMQTCSRQH